MSENPETPAETEAVFKKPILIGRVGRFPKKALPKNAVKETAEKKAENKPELAPIHRQESPQVTLEAPKVTQENQIDNALQMRYKEPPWSGIVEHDYGFEVLKSGVILETFKLAKQAYFSIGRLSTCNIALAHPTVSRYHAILQYRGVKSDDKDIGFYIYDLGSTHGTFLNRNRIKPKLFVRCQVGHMLRFGNSTRSYLLTGPDEDAEQENELSLTELKKLRTEVLKEREQAEIARKLKEEKDEEEKLKKEEEQGIDWGMGEDADEATDLSENPFATTNNEHFYVDDPKKSLRGFMEREGYELNYEVTEKGMGQFLCSVELPIDDTNGRPIVAEAMVKGKKKEAVVQCALEACRILDQHGVLRQSHHESRKRKSKNWENDDYYDSDDDTFLDRTGAVETKRQQRMKTKHVQQPETYQSLIEKEQTIRKSISELETKLRTKQELHKKASEESDAADSLDAFMTELQQDKPDKHEISKIKSELSKLKAEHVKVVKLVNIAKPADLPALVVPSSKAEVTSVGKSTLPVFGKRLKLKVQLPNRDKASATAEKSEDIDNESDPEEADNEAPKEAALESSQELSQRLEDIVLSLQEEEQLVEKLPEAKKLKASLAAIVEKVDLAKYDMSDLAKSSQKVSAIALELENLKKYVRTKYDVGDDEAEEEDVAKKAEMEAKEAERRRKRNIRRTMQRQEKAKTEKQEQYKLDADREGYDMWTPPQNQSGDGKTSLNEKFGY